MDSHSHLDQLHSQTSTNHQVVSRQTKSHMFIISFPIQIATQLPSKKYATLYGLNDNRKEKVNFFLSSAVSNFIQFCTYSPYETSLSGES